MTSNMAINEKEEAGFTSIKTSSSDHRASGSDRSWTDEEEKKLLRKLDYVLMPALWMMSLISHLDRSK
jgi:hypothetical protein